MATTIIGDFNTVVNTYITRLNTTTDPNELQQVIAEVKRQKSHGFKVGAITVIQDSSALNTALLGAILRAERVPCDPRSPRSQIPQPQPLKSAPSQPSAPKAATPQPLTQKAATPGRQGVVLNEQEYRSFLLNCKKLEANASNLDRIFQKGNVESQEDAELTTIRENPALNEYFTYFGRLLTGSWIAAQAISSNMVADGQMYTSDYIANLLDIACEQIPGVPSNLFSGVMSLLNAKEKATFVQNIAFRFPTLNVASKELETLARKLTLARSDLIQRLYKEPDHTDLVSKMKVLFMNDDMAGSPLTKQASDDCQKILRKISEKKSADKPTVDEMVTAATGRPVIPSLTLPAVQALSLSKESSDPEKPPQDSTVRKEVRKLRAATEGLTRELADLKDSGLTVGKGGQLQQYRPKPPTQADSQQIPMAQVLAQFAMMQEQMSKLQEENQELRTMIAGLAKRQG